MGMKGRRKLIPGGRRGIGVQNVYLQLFSPLRLGNRQLCIPGRNQLNVYPDMKQLSDYALLARTNRLSLIGVRKRAAEFRDNCSEMSRETSTVAVAVNAPQTAFGHTGRIAKISL